MDEMTVQEQESYVRLFYSEQSITAAASASGNIRNTNQALSYYVLRSRELFDRLRRLMPTFLANDIWSLYSSSFEFLSTKEVARAWLYVKKPSIDLNELNRAISFWVLEEWEPGESVANPIYFARALRDTNDIIVDSIVPRMETRQMQSAIRFLLNRDMELPIVKWTRMFPFMLEMSDLHNRMKDDRQLALDVAQSVDQVQQRIQIDSLVREVHENLLTWWLDTIVQDRDEALRKFVESIAEVTAHVFQNKSVNDLKAETLANRSYIMTLLNKTKDIRSVILDYRSGNSILYEKEISRELKQRISVQGLDKTIYTNATLKELYETLKTQTNDLAFFY